MKCEHTRYFTWCLNQKSLCSLVKVSSTDSRNSHPQVSSQEILKIQKITGQQNLKLPHGGKPRRQQAKGISINLPKPI